MYRQKQPYQILYFPLFNAGLYSLQRLCLWLHSRCGDEQQPSEKIESMIFEGFEMKGGFHISIQ
jgi:hypothetical protein